MEEVSGCKLLWNLRNCEPAAFGFLKILHRGYIMNLKVEYQFEAVGKIT